MVLASMGLAITPSSRSLSALSEVSPTRMGACAFLVSTLGMTARTSYVHFGVSIAYLRQETCVNETDVKTRSRIAPGLRLAAQDLVENGEE